MVSSPSTSHVVRWPHLSLETGGGGGAFISGSVFVLFVFAFQLLGFCFMAFLLLCILASLLFGKGV